MTRTKEEVALVLRLSHEGLNHCQIARRTGIPRCTVRDWVNGQVPRRAHRKKPGCPRCGHDPHDFAGLPQQEYVYLLGMYLGDGYIVATTKGVYRLRIFLDMAYPGIIRECAAAMQVVLPDNRIDIRQTQPTHNCVHVGVYSRALPCLFPQHGPGMKHTRPIFPSDWQQLLVDEDPRPLIRGLIHSDGCRVINKSMGHKYLRYMFRNKSRDIRNIFKDACWQLGIPYKQSREDTISISRREGIEILDSFVGPKY